jgi:hypothetical protein
MPSISPVSHEDHFSIRLVDIDDEHVTRDEAARKARGSSVILERSPVETP